MPHLHAPLGGRDQEPRTTRRLGLVPTSAEPSRLILLSASLQPGPLHADGGLVLGPSPPFTWRTCSPPPCRASVPTYRPASTTAEATGHQPHATRHLRLDLHGPRAGGTD